MSTRLFRHRLALRTFCVALLLLAVVIKPALVVASEAHETGHTSQTGHVHDADDDGPGIPADEADASHGDAGWHLLMHLGHCCNHPSGLAVMSFEFGELPPPDHPPLARQAQPCGAERAQELRPPIVG